MKQLWLKFEPDKEARRLERVARICGIVPQVETAARYFDNQSYREATHIAHQSNEDAV